MKKKVSGKIIKARKKSPGPTELAGDFESLVASIVQIHHHARDFAAKAVNVGLTLLLAHRGVQALQPFLHLSSRVKRETLSPESEIVESRPPQLPSVHANLSNQLFVSRYAVEMPDKSTMESFLKQIGKEIGHAP